jgi:glyoxylase-like metal-dependent hydrolase (beta-lactamase superfamily II)
MPMSTVPTNAVSAMRIGNFRCFPISDGNLVYPRAMLCGNDPERAVGIPDPVAVPYTPLLVDTGSERILVDTGAGPLAPTTGHLEQNLLRAGFKASDIDVVVLSHAHPDHIGGLVLEDGTARFRNARVLMSRREYDFWHTADLRGRLGSGSLCGSPELENLMGQWLDRYLSPVRDRLEWLSDEMEIAPGIMAIDAPGHTPGHLAIQISSDRESMLFAGDVLLMPGQVVNPDWTSAFDIDAQLLIATRRRLLDRSAADDSIVFHYHFGEAGRFHRRGAQFGWEPLS